MNMTGSERIGRDVGMKSLVSIDRWVEPNIEVKLGRKGFRLHDSNLLSPRTFNDFFFFARWIWSGIAYVRDDTREERPVNKIREDRRSYMPEIKMTSIEEIRLGYAC